MAGFVQFNGPPGDVFVNDTGNVLYQFICNFQNSCGVCVQYHLAIGPSFPIPLHFSCRCRQRLVAPGRSAEPFEDFREKVRELNPAQQSRVVGSSNYKLIQKGVVGWGDVVTEGRVRDFREVVSRENLSVKTMIKAGVKKADAERAHASVNTAAHEIANESRKRLIEALKAKGLSNKQIERSVGERLAGRASIGKGPSGPGAMPVIITPVGPPPPPLGLFALEDALGVTFTDAAREALDEEPSPPPPPPPDGEEPPDEGQ